MPKHWIDSSGLKIEESDSEETVNEKLFNQSIVADKKPYFFIYNYPGLYKDYNSYIKNSRKSCHRAFGIELEELLEKNERNDEEERFVDFYYKMMPVNKETCIVNEICWIFESEFDSIKNDFPEFNPEILKTNAIYTPREYASVKEIYDSYSHRIKEHAMKVRTSYVDKDEKKEARELFRQMFEMDCYSVVPNEEVLCNILVDMCYTNNKSKQLVWDICGGTIINNLLEKNDHKMNIPVKNATGDISYCGEKFSMLEVDVSREEENL